MAAVGTPTPFDELWAVYPRRHQRPKAKRAYQALNPDPANHARMLAAARDLAVYHETNGVDLRWCPFLHSWIEGERYLEDAPTPYKDPKAAAIAAKRGKPKAAAAKPTPSKAQKTKATGKTSGRPAAKPRAKRVARGPYTYAREIKRQERRRLAEEAAPKPLKPKGPPLGSGVWLRHQRQLLDVPACEVAEALAWRGEVEVHSFEERNNAVLSASQRKKLAPVFEAYAARTGGGPNGHVDA